jgi:hypothetical protein
VFDGLASARLKIIRASEHIKAIEDIIATYSAGEPHEIIPQANRKEKIHIVREPPPEISIIAGEVFYQLRSALDHLIFDLVKLNRRNVVLPFGWEKRCEFPLLTEVPTKGNPPIAYNLPLQYSLFEKGLPGITAQAFTFIEAVQPYNGRSPVIMGSLDTLKALAKLSNIDKHRHLNVTVAKVRKNELVTCDPGGQRGGWTIFHDNAEIEPVIGTESAMGRAVDMERTFTTIVAFGESTLPDIANVPVQVLLHLCAYTVETLIVPAFEKFIQNP